MKRPPDPVEAEEASDPYEVGKSLALRRLGRLPQTGAQLCDYLVRKGIPVEVAGEIVDRMIELRLVDDAEYAGMWIRSRRAIRHSGNAAIRRELQSRGVAADVIEAAFATEQVDEVELATALAERKWQSLARLDEPARSNRVVGLLVRRGHSLGTAYRVVGELRAKEL